METQLVLPVLNLPRTMIKSYLERFRTLSWASVSFSIRFFESSDSGIQEATPCGAGGTSCSTFICNFFTVMNSIENVDE